VLLTQLGCWVLDAADAAGLWDAAGAAGLLDIGYCARLLSCCDAGDCTMLLDVDLYAEHTGRWFAAELRYYAGVLRKAVG
jgi:hypothetical protein